MMSYNYYKNKLMDLRSKKAKIAKTAIIVVLVSAIAAIIIDKVFKPVEKEPEEDVVE
jgi:hypothetical protein